MRIQLISGKCETRSNAALRASGEGSEQSTAIRALFELRTPVRCVYGIASLPRAAGWNREEFQCRTPTPRLEAARLELRWAGLVPTGGFAPIPKGGEVAARALSAENGLHAGVQSAGR